MAASTATVLYVEDDADDLSFFRRALQAEKVECIIQTVSNVAAAKSYMDGKSALRRSNPVSIANRDSDGPDERGRGESSIELVRWIRSSPGLVSIPILCTSGNDQRACSRNSREWELSATRKQ